MCLGGDDEMLSWIVLVAKLDADSAEERAAQGKCGIDIVQTGHAEETDAGDDIPRAELALIFILPVAIAEMGAFYNSKLAC